LVRTAFLHALATSFNLAARYEEALATAKQLLLDADQFRLDLPFPYAALDQAVAEIGLKRLSDALTTLRRVDEAVRPRDPFLQLLAGLVRARVFLSQGRARTALGILARLDATGTSPPAIAELFAWRGLVLAKTARFNDALQCIASARSGISTSVEARILITGTEAICAEPDTHERVKRLSELWSLVQATGNVDTFAAIYRAAPSLLPELAAAGENETPLRALLHRLGDVELARTAGLMIDGAIDSLTPRERQVANLLVEGLSNQEIASRLYISPATVKVHVRHIYEKLGVRNRSGAIVKLR
jgi:ATP/maltotriose-dependent transcriptional regulator MalT